MSAKAATFEETDGSLEFWQHFKTIRVRARDIQSHERGNKALVGTVASKFVGTIRLSR